MSKALDPPGRQHEYFDDENVAVPIVDRLIYHSYQFAINKELTLNFSSVTAGEVAMRPRRVFPEGTAVRTAALLKQAKAVADYRRILCVHLRAAFGESNPVIAAKTGLSESTIRKVHAAFLQRGEAALTTRPRGGRRRAHLTVAEEAAVVQPFLVKAKAGGVVEIGPIRQAYQAQLGTPVAPSTVYRVLRRHGWRKIAPRPRHPRADRAAQQAFKKISPPSSPKPDRLRRR